MATTDSATTTTPKKPATAAKRKPATAAKRKPAAKQATRATARSTSSSSTQPATRVAAVQQIAERVVLIPAGAALEARDRVAGTVTELVTPIRALARRTLGSNVEVVTGRVENVVQNGVNAGIKLVSGARDRIARAA